MSLLSTLAAPPPKGHVTLYEGMRSDSSSHCELRISHTWLRHLAVFRVGNPKSYFVPKLSPHCETRFQCAPKSQL